MATAHPVPGHPEPGQIENAILIAGPTASGKSALALEIAERENGVIVNTDSMQVYDVLNVLTARPDADDLARAPHLLYGHVPPSLAYSTGAWARDVRALADQGVFAERRPIFVGGTGLYFRALLEGLSKMPDIPAEIRTRWRDRLSEEGAPHLHGLLTDLDPAAASRLKAGDGQRIVRALEVLEASGRSILEWQTEKTTPVIHQASARMQVIDIDRELLGRRIETRLDLMAKRGVMDEVRTLLSLDLDPTLPAMRAIGVAEFAAAARGEMSIETAIERAKITTRQYAKRQMTWFRNQLGAEWVRSKV